MSSKKVLTDDRMTHLLARKYSNCEYRGGGGEGWGYQPVSFGEEKNVNRVNDNTYSKRKTLKKSDKEE